MKNKTVVSHLASAWVLTMALSSHAVADLDPGRETFKLSADPNFAQRDEFEIAPYQPKTSYWLSYSKRGTTAGGAIGWRDYRMKGLAFELGFSDTSEIDPYSIRDDFPPIGTIPVGVFNSGGLLGIDTLYFFGSRDAEFFVGIGFYSQSQQLIGRVPGRNRNYSLGSLESNYVALSVGTRLWVHRRFGIGASYHSERGSTFTVAIRS